MIPGSRAVPELCEGARSPPGLSPLWAVCPVYGALLHELRPRDLQQTSSLQDTILNTRNTPCPGAQQLPDSKVGPLHTGVLHAAGSVYAHTLWQQGTELITSTS